MAYINKILGLINSKLEKHERGLYIVLVFPIAFACLLTFAIARAVSFFWPQLYVEWSPGLHVHHFAYGFFVLVLAGYLALVFSGPRAKFLISLLYGVGAGLAFDEFAMWIHLEENDWARWQYDGLVVAGAVFFLIATVQPGVRFFTHHWPFTRQKLISEDLARRQFSWDDGNKYDLDKR